MSRLAIALHAQPPGSLINEAGLELQRLQTLLDQHEQCRRAFLQAPSPRLGAALRQIEASIKYRTTLCRKKGFL